MKVPPFVSVAHDEASRKATLSVEDATEKHQRAMWGTSFLLPGFTRVCLTVYRNHTSASAKLRPRSLRRPYLHLEFGWCWFPC